MNMHSVFCRETGPPEKPARIRDPFQIAQLYIFSRRRKYLIRLKVLAKYSQGDIREQALTELKRVAAYTHHGFAAWELNGEDTKDKNNARE